MRKRAPPAPLPKPDPDNEPTRVMSRLLPCPMCGGSGVADGILPEPFVSFCGCTAGMRLKCAVPEGGWPMFNSAARLRSTQIGLNGDAN
jgi:hypothetical protein